MDGGLELVQKVRIAAPIDRVWAAWTDPERLTAWYPEQVSGPVAAGRRVRFGWEGLGLAIDLEVQAAAAPHRLVLRATPPGRPAQVQQVDLAASGAETELTLRHRGFTDDPAGRDERAGSAAGWAFQLAVLRHHIERHWDRARRVRHWVTAARAAPGACALWERLGGLPAPPVAEQPCRLELAAGVGLRGAVLSVSDPYQLGVTWDGGDGVLALRVVPAGAARLIVVHLAAWSASEARWRAVEEALGPVLAAIASPPARA